MTPEDFVSSISEVVVDENVGIYRKLFSETVDSEASDPYWRRALHLYNSLSSAQKEVFIEIVQQVAIDTVSHVLGVIDGTNAVTDPDTTFELLCDGTPIEGNLKSLFLQVRDEEGLRRS